LKEIQQYIVQIKNYNSGRKKTLFPDLFRFLKIRK